MLFLLLMALWPVLAVIFYVVLGTSAGGECYGPGEWFDPEEHL